MKTPSSIKKIKKSIENSNLELLQAYYDIKKEYNKLLTSEIKEILIKVSSDYNINLEELENKYMNKFEKKKKSKKNESSEEDNQIACEEKNDENIMTKVSMNGIECYCEKKEGGTIYNKDATVIGKYINGKISLF